MLTRRLAAIAFIAFIFAFPQDADAQRRYNYFSLGVNIGVAHYQGDLDDNGFDWWNVFNSSENKNIGSPFRLFRPGFGASLNYHFHPHMHARITFNQGWIGASDENNTVDSRVYRNLHFRSHVTEVSAQLVYEFFATQRHYRYRPNWSPYIYAGIAVFNFSPKAQPDQAWVEAFPGAFQDANEWVPLQPLGTEGQFLDDPDGRYPEPYALTQISIPIGIGVRRKLTDRMDLRLELGIRKTFTDYLDDVSGQITPATYFNPNDTRPITGGAYASMDQFAEQGQIKAALFSDRSGYRQFGAAVGDLQPGGHNPAGGVRGGAWKAAGEVRGNINDDDWYAFTTIGISYILDKPDRCPKFK